MNASCAAKAETAKEPTELGAAAEADSLVRKQVADYGKLDSLARQVSDLLTEIECDRRRLSELSSVAHRRAPLQLATHKWREANPLCLNPGADEETRRRELQSFTHERKIVISMDYASSPLAEIIASMESGK